ncbi:stage III sporulation protein AG [Lutibacter sp. B2]|nr:stage III sporulation protein AG [Lutibacter sp. B2]
MNIFEKLKEILSNKEEKKLINNLMIIVLICTIGLITWDTFSSQKKISNVGTSDKAQEDSNEYNNGYQSQTEAQLKKILSQIKGVGEVDVMITYETSAEVVPAINVTKSSQLTEEKDAQGGVRTTTQEDSSQNIVTTNQKNDLIVIKEIKPDIKGVVIVAKGASDIGVKNELIEAVRTIFQIPSFKVMVYEKDETN